MGSDVVDEGTFPWLSSSTISGQAPVPIGQGETSVPEEDAEFDVFTLLGTYTFMTLCHMPIM